MTKQTIKTEGERSAGGVLWRPGVGSEPQICLIATRGSTRWQLPKGHPGAGEPDADAARRETREETGCTGDLEDDLGEIVFWFFVGAGPARKRVKKTVRFYLLRYTGGDTADHDAEVDEARWWPAGEAQRALTFDSERNVLAAALKKLAAAPAVPGGAAPGGVAPGGASPAS